MKGQIISAVIVTLVSFATISLSNMGKLPHGAYIGFIIGVVTTFLCQLIIISNIKE